MEGRGWGREGEGGTRKGEGEGERERETNLQKPRKHHLCTCSSLDGVISCTLLDNSYIKGTPSHDYHMTSCEHQVTCVRSVLSGRGAAWVNVLPTSDQSNIGRIRGRGGATNVSLHKRERRMSLQRAHTLPPHQNIIMYMYVQLQ